MMSGLLANPVHAFQSWNFSKVLGVVCDHRQTILSCGDSYHNIKIANGQSAVGKRLSNLCIVTNPVAKRQDCKRLFNLSWLFKMFLNSIAVKRPVCKLGNAYFRGKNLPCRCFINMNIYPTTMVEVFNPCISIKDITFHGRLIVKINFAIKRTAIVTMLHHLIVLFAFCILRPNASHFQKFGFTLFCLRLRHGFLGHNQLVSQPLAVGL